MTPREEIYQEMARIARSYGFKPCDMTAKPSRKCTTPAKVACIKMLRQKGKSWSQIAGFMDRDHSSVAQLHAYIAKIDRRHLL